MPSLAAPLKKWIAQCKAYAAKHGCSYKEAMSALKKSRKRGQTGGGVADHAASVEGFSLHAGKEGMEAAAGAPGAGAHAGTPPPPTAHAGAPAAAHAGAPAAAHAGAPAQSGGQAMFEAGAVEPNKQQQTAGGKYGRRNSKRKSRHSRSRSQRQNHTGGKKKGRKSHRRSRNYRGGSPLAYSQY